MSTTPPPFLWDFNQLERAKMKRNKRRAQLQHRFNEAARADAVVGDVFELQCKELARPHAQQHYDVCAHCLTLFLA